MPCCPSTRRPVSSSRAAPSRTTTTACTCSGAGSNWYIADNTIRGDTPASSESFAGEGIDLNITSGHTVAHNRISNVADGISYPYVNVDIFGNDIFDSPTMGSRRTTGGRNVRMWGNRIHNAVHNGISFQPQAGGPWYIVRNQIVGNKEGAFKFRTTDRFVLLHNTIVNWGNAWPGTSLMCCNEDHLLRALRAEQSVGVGAGRPDLGLGRGHPATGAPISTTTASTGAPPRTRSSMAA